MLEISRVFQSSYSFLSLVGGMCPAVQWENPSSALRGPAE